MCSVVCLVGFSLPVTLGWAGKGLKAFRRRHQHWRGRGRRVRERRGATWLKKEICALVSMWELNSPQKDANNARALAGEWGSGKEGKSDVKPVGTKGK